MASASYPKSKKKGSLKETEEKNDKIIDKIVDKLVVRLNDANVKVINSNSKEERQKSFQTCTRCGRKAHDKNEVCPAQGRHCSKCNKPNHFANVCRMKSEENSKSSKGVQNQTTCKKCGRKAHTNNEECLAKGKTCNRCKKLDHFSNMCRTPMSDDYIKNNTQIHESDSSSSKDILAGVLLGGLAAAGVGGLIALGLNEAKV